MEKRKRTHIEELIEEQFVVTDPKVAEKILEALEEPAQVKMAKYPEDIYVNLLGHGDIYIKRNSAVYKMNIDKFLKEFCCLVKEEDFE